MGTFYNDDCNYYLAHYGVIGMKWGVRKNNKTLTEQQISLKANKKANRNRIIGNAASKASLGAAAGAISALGRRNYSRLALPSYGSYAQGKTNTVLNGALKGAAYAGLTTLGVEGLKGLKNEASRRSISRNGSKQNNQMIDDTISRQNTQSRIDRLTPSSVNSQGRVTTWYNTPNDEVRNRRRRN